ncbi:MAG: hypothetical protein V9G19_25120 [Tetrasphaera sp.]
MDRPRRTRLLLGLFVLSLLLSALLLFLPGPGGNPHFPHEDKVVHATIFGLPTALGLLAGLRAHLLIPALLAYAAASEVIQGAFLPTRSGSVRDGLADLAGITLGVVVVAMVRGGRHTRE